MKPKQSSKGKRAELGKRSAQAGNFVDRNLKDVSPATTHFEPTDQSPVRQRYKMAGGA